MVGNEAHRILTYAITGQQQQSTDAFGREGRSLGRFVAL